MGLHSSLWFSNIANLAVYSNGWVNAAVYGWQNRHICRGLRDVPRTFHPYTSLGKQNLEPVKTPEINLELFQQDMYFMCLMRRLPLVLFFYRWYTRGTSCWFAALLDVCLSNLAGSGVDWRRPIRIFLLFFLVALNRTAWPQGLEKWGFAHLVDFLGLGWHLYRRVFICRKHSQCGIFSECQEIECWKTRFASRKQHLARRICSWWKDMLVTDGKALPKRSHLYWFLSVECQILSNQLSIKLSISSKAALHWGNHFMWALVEFRDSFHRR